MSAKQRHRARVTERLTLKLESLETQESLLHNIIKDYVAKAREKSAELFALEDVGKFLQQYGQVEQHLDKVNNTCELLATSAEEMIENGDGNFDSHYDESQISTMDRTRNPSGDDTISEQKAQANNLPNSKQETSCDQNNILDNIVTVGEYQIFPKSKLDQSDVSMTADQTLESTSKVLPSVDKKCELTREHADKNKPLGVGVGTIQKKRGCKSVPNDVKKQFVKELGAEALPKLSPAEKMFTSEVITTSSPNASPRKMELKQKKKSPKKKSKTSKSDIKSDVNEKKGNVNTCITSLETGATTDIPKDNTNKPSDSVKKTKLLENDKKNVRRSVNEHDSQKLLTETKTVSNQDHKNNQNSSKICDKSCDKTVGVQGKLNEVKDLARELLAEIKTIEVESSGSQNVQMNPIIPRAAFLTRDYTPVVVSEIISPWCFFVQHNGSQIMHFMEQICTYMSKTGLAEKPPPDPRVGMMCLAKYSRDISFYRAYITQVYTDTDGHVTDTDVLYVDWGNRERVKVIHLRPLPDQFTQLPTQAICCALAKVIPCSKYGVWKEEDIISFRQYTTNQQLTCVPVCRSSGATLPYLVELVGNYPMPAYTQNNMFMNHQEDIGVLMTKRGQAKYIDVADQISLLGKSGEGRDEAMILNQNVAPGSGVEITELNDSVHHTPLKVPMNQQHQDLSSVSEIPAASNDKHNVDTDKQKEVVKVRTSHSNEDNEVLKTGFNKMTKTVSADKESSCVDVITSDNSVVTGQSDAGGLGDNVEEQREYAIKGTNTSRSEWVSKICDQKNTGAPKKDESLISPRSETSDTESTCDNNGRGGVSNTDQSQPVTNDNSVGGSGLLPRIKEEMDIATSDTMSSITDFGGSEVSDIGLASSDLDMDIYLNPNGQDVMLAHVVSPEHFYVHVISQQVGQTLDKLMKSLNLHFEKLNRRKLTKLSKTFDPEVGIMCCAQFISDDNFYRAVILKISTKKDANTSEKGTIFVHYIDFGDEEWLPRRRLFPLPNQYSRVPSLAIRCCLAYIAPPSGNKDGDGAPKGGDNWPESSTNQFTNLSGFEKILQMHVVHSTPSSENINSVAGLSASLGVLLVDNSGTEEICINLDLIRDNHAVLTSPTHGDQQLAIPTQHNSDGDSSSSAEVLDWNPMEDDFFSKRNSYNIDVDDVGVATTGYKSKDETTVCKYYGAGRRCWRGDRCPYRHVRQTDSGVTLDRDEVYAIGGNQEELLPDVNSWLAIEVTTILSPSHFYVILPMGCKSLDTAQSDKGHHEKSGFDKTGTEETLDDLLAALNLEYSKRRSHESTLILRAPGEIVAARFTQDQQWYRARVIEVMEEEVKVFFVDFGNTEKLSDREILDIKPEFLHLPFQALECFLHNIEPVGDTDTWSKDSTAYYRELVDGKTLVGHVKSRSYNGCLWLELYDTSCEDDVNIGEMLIQNGYAVRANLHTDSSCNVSDAGTSRMSSCTGSEHMVPG